MFGLFSRRALVPSNPLVQMRNGLKPITQISNYIVTPKQKKEIPIYEPLKPLRDGQQLMPVLYKSLLEKYDPTKTKREYFNRQNPRRLRAGDTVRVNYVDESSPILGVIIAIKNSGIDSNMVLRQKVGGLGVELRVPIFHPNVAKIDLLGRIAKFRHRNKHYYIRNTRLDVGDVESAIKKRQRMRANILRNRKL